MLLQFMSYKLLVTSNFFKRTLNWLLWTLATMIFYVLSLDVISTTLVGTLQRKLRTIAEMVCDHDPVCVFMATAHTGKVGGHSHSRDDSQGIFFSPSSDCVTIFGADHCRQSCRI